MGHEGDTPPQQLVQIPKRVDEACINSWMNRNGVTRFGVKAGAKQTMRNWVHQPSFETQHLIGVELPRHCGVEI